ncbi:MAG: prolyl-tRNA synthetase associated domain-containing protein [Chlamydiae bacterium]|nr:prolyl-tRNA synthetase associated domain-containing protein [Chlamydiota bacterium]
MNKNDSDVENFLRSHGIDYILHIHPAVFTCDEAKKICKDIPGLPCKNLFLQDREGKRFFLVILPAEKKLDFAKFAKLMEANKVVFGDNKMLQEKLKVEPGSVSLFGILNDQQKEVELCIDQEVYQADIVSFHPNINTATIELAKEMFHKFLKSLDRNFKILEL